MALIFVDGIPYSAPSTTYPKKWTVARGGPGYTGENLTVETSGGRFGGRWLKFVGGAGWPLWAHTYVLKTFGGTADTLMAQFGLMPISYDATEGTGINIFSFLDGSTQQISMYLDYGIMSIYRGNAAALLGACSGAISSGVWHQVEFKVKFHATEGTVLVKIDGVTVLNLTGQNTKTTANAYATGIWFESQYGGGKIHGISDIIIMDTTGDYCNDLLGTRMVELRVPTANGHYSDFLPSASPGENWQMVDEVPPDDDTTFNTGDIDAIDTFEKDPISNPTATVDAVVCSVYSKTNDGGSASVAGAVRSGGVDAIGTVLPVPSSYEHVQSIIYVDPNTAAQFTAAGINAAELGYKRTA